jgi:hypothetical protein
MTREEAIQEQIDEIMDSFDFEGVQGMMRAVNWTWLCEGESLKNKVPELYDIKKSARQRMREAAKHGYSSTGGFTARLIENEDESGPWLLIDLQFGPQSLMDGTTYVRQDRVSSEA